MRVGVLASGRGTNLQALLHACQDPAPARVVVVASRKPSSGAIQLAERSGIATAIIDDPDDGPALAALLHSHDVELVVLAGYVKLVPSAVVDAFSDRMLNIHPAPLPAFGGPGMYGIKVHEAVLASGATVSGATVHLVDREYDRGPIVAQWPVPVAAGDTPESLATRVLAVEHQLLPTVVLAAARAGHVVRLVAQLEHFDTTRTPRTVAEALEPA